MAGMKIEQESSMCPRLTHYLSLAILLGLALPAAADPVPIIPCQVDRIVDGDTFRATCHPWPGWSKEAAVRILEIDTPERGWRAKCDAEAELAEQATAAAVELLSGTVQLAIEGRDNFGRLLAGVILPDGRDYGREMLRRGLAAPYAEHEKGWC